MCRIGCHCTRGHVALPQSDIKFLAVALAPMRSGFRVVAASVTKATFCVNRRRVAALCVTGWVPGAMRTVRISAARNRTALCRMLWLRRVSRWLGTSPGVLSDAHHLVLSVYSHSHTMSVLVRGGSLRGRHSMSLLSISPDSGMPNTQRSQQCLSR